MKRTFFTLLLSLVFSSFSTLGALELAQIFAETKSDSIQTISKQQLQDLLNWGITRGDNIFDLLNKTIVYLNQKNLRIQISGDDYRALSVLYDLGGDRINALVPTSKISSIYLGAAKHSGDAMLDVFLKEKYSQYLEIADFTLESHYGFKKVEPFFFKEAFGVRVTQMFVGWDVSLIEVENTVVRNNIAIHLNMFPRPKRWTIGYIRLR